MWGHSQSWAISQPVLASQTDSSPPQSLSQDLPVCTGTAVPSNGSSPHPCSSPHGRLPPAGLPRFTLGHVVGELCLLVAHLSKAVQAVASLWKG